MASVGTEEDNALRRSMLSLEQMLEGKTSLKTQKLTHRNIICIGTDILNEIETFMNSDRDAAVHRAIQETEAKLYKERQKVIDEIVENLVNDHKEELEKARKRAEEEIAAVKYRCEVAEKKRHRIAQQKYETEKEEALRKAAEEAAKTREEAVELAEKELREKMLIENQEYTKKAVDQTKYEMKIEADARVEEAVQNTKESCERNAAALLAEVKGRHYEEITTINTRLVKLTLALEMQKNEKEEYEKLFVDLKDDYKRFQNYTQGFCSDYLLK